MGKNKFINVVYPNNTGGIIVVNKEKCRDYFDKGEFENAIDCFDQLLANDPDNIELIYGKASALLENENYEKAIEFFDDILKIDENYVDAICAKGVALMGLDKLQEAEKYFDKALFLDPNHLLSLFNNANLLFDSENFSEALEYYQKTVDLAPDFVNAWFNVGLTLFILGNYNDAIKKFDKTIDLDPDNVEAWYLKGYSLELLRNYDDALICYNHTLQLNPDDPSVLFSKGRIFTETGEYEKAIRILNRSLKLDSENAEIWYYKGLIFENQDKLDEALEMYNKALSLQNDESEYYNAKGRVMAGKDNLDEALTFFDKALTLDPQNNGALYNKAYAVMEKGNTRLALDLFQEVVQIDPKYDDAWLQMGLINDRQGNKQKALSNFRKMTEINPENDLAWYNQGVMYRELKQSQNALECFNKAIKISPDYTDAWYLKGNVLRELNQENEAINAYTKFIEIVEKNDISEDKLTAKRVKEFIRMSKDGEVVSVSPSQKTQYWQWVTKAEYFLEADGRERESLDPEHGSEPGGYWTCHKDTRIGDLILLYRAGKKDGVTYQDIKYLIQAQSDAYTIDYDEYAFEHGWQYGCDYKPLFKFDNSISYHELTEDPYLEDWNALRIRFQGIAFRTEERHWKRLEELLKEKNPEYKDFLKGFKPKKVKEIADSEKWVEDKLFENLNVLKKFGYNLDFIGRQVRCIGQGGRIDLLCEDKEDGSLVIIELKIVKATRNTFGQISNYVGWAIKRKAKGRNVKGIVISKGFDSAFDMALLTNNDINHIELADVLDELGVKLK